MRYFKTGLISGYFVFSFVIGQCQNMEDSIRFKYTLWNVAYRNAIVEVMVLEESEKAAFWGVYDAYCRDLEFLDIEYLQIVELYSSHWNDLTARHLKTLSSALHQNDLMLTDIRKQYYRRFSEVLSTTKVSQFMSYDLSLRLMFRSEFGKNTPVDKFYNTPSFSLEETTAKK